MPGRLFAIGAIFLLGMPSISGAASALDNRTTYEISIPTDNHRYAVVTVSLATAGRDFYMFPGANQLPRRWATFVSNFQVQDANGQVIPATTRDDGTWQLSRMPQGPVTLSYRVRLDHENHTWSAGVDGAAYWREWGVFYTARSLFIVNGEEREDIAVRFSLPDHWRVTAPWEKQNGHSYHFVVPDYDVLATSMFFAGTHEEISVQQGPFELLLALGGEEIQAQADEFANMAGGVLDYYVDLMGDVPRLRAEGATGTPVVIINQAEMTDGEAIGNNISILLEPAGNPMAQQVARLIFAHEFFHLWNGKSFMPTGEDGEWFKEGFTNYYALKALHHTGDLNDESFLQVLSGLFYQRYASDDAVGRESITNGQLKHDHWGLIYAGGLLVAIAQDLQIRSVTDNEQSIDDLMRFMFNEHSDNPYDLTDIEHALDELNNTDQADFFERYVLGIEQIPIAQYLALAGIEALEEDGRTVFRIRDDADARARDIRSRMFGN